MNDIDLGRPWEPWTPKLRDRVRILESPECPHPHSPDHVDRYAQIMAFTDSPTGHRYRVNFLSAGWVWADYAAIEMELIAEATR